MKLHDEVTKSKVNNYMLQPKHHTTAKMFKQPNPVLVKQITDKEGLHKAYALDNKLYAHGDTLYIAGFVFLLTTNVDLESYSF